MKYIITESKIKNIFSKYFGIKSLEKGNTKQDDETQNKLKIQPKLDNVVFKYLDLKRFVKMKPLYNEGIVLGNRNKRRAPLCWLTNGDLYIYFELVQEISNTFGFDEYYSESLIGRWVTDRYQLTVTETIYDFGSIQLDVKPNSEVID